MKENIIEGKSLERYFDFNDALLEFHKLFNVENKDERSIAILGGTFLELALENILKEFLPDNSKQVEELFKFPQPLSNFSSKISFCYSLGLIDKLIYKDLTLVRKIRNEFAHNLYVSFENSNIKDWTFELKFYKVSMMNNIPNGISALNIYQVAVNQLITNLNGCISIAKSQKRKTLDNLEKYL